MQLTKRDSLRKAQQLVDQGRLSYAISIYQKVVDDDPSDLNVISTLGDLYVKAGRTSDAVEHLLRIAESYLRVGSAVSAALILKKVLKIDATNPIAQMNLGELHVQDNDIERAHEAFIEAGAAFWHKGNIAAAIRMNKRALEIAPDSRHAKAALALLGREADQSTLPEPKKEIVSDLPEIIISIADGSDAVCAPVTFGDSQLQRDSISGSGDPSSQRAAPATRDEDAMIQQIARAEFLVGCGQIDEAINALRESLQDKPDHIPTREKLKDIYLRFEMIDRASEECVNIAAIYIARGEAGRAADYVTRARLLRPSVEPGSAPGAPQTGAAKKAEGVEEPSGDSGLEHNPPITVM